jgi:hypothetical protein
LRLFYLLNTRLNGRAGNALLNIFHVLKILHGRFIHIFCVSPQWLQLDGFFNG